MNDIDYFIKDLDDRRTSVAKFVDDTINQVYVQENQNCDCPGAIYHRVECKHLKIKKAWIKLGKPVGYFTVTKKGDPVFHINHEAEVQNTWLSQPTK